MGWGGDDILRGGINVKQAPKGGGSERFWTQPEGGMRQILEVSRRGERIVSDMTYFWITEIQCFLLFFMFFGVFQIF